MSLPDAIHIVVLTTVPLAKRKGLEQLLDAFESVEDLAPTNWGPDERARNPYDRAELIGEVADTDDEYVPGLRRSKPPRYQAYFWAENAGLKMVRVEFGSGLRKKDPALIFKLGDALANALETEYGFVHLIWRDEDAEGTYSATSVMTADKFQSCGPKPPAARTWFGPHLVRLIGRKRLEETGVPIKETRWGGIELDLTAGPWEADFATLSRQQAAVMEQLGPSEVFGDYRDWHDCKPGAKWKPIPVKK